jgi:hypothetical protein
MIATPTGERKVESLKTGDLVLTADGRSVSAKVFSTQLQSTTKATAPYLIPAHAFGTSRPARDLVVSPKHAIQSRKGIWQIPEFAALTNTAIKQINVGKPVSYYHLELPNYFTDNLIANGTVAESLAGKQVDRTKTLYKYSKKVDGFLRQGPSREVSREGISLNQV